MSLLTEHFISNSTLTTETDLPESVGMFACSKLFGSALTSLFFFDVRNFRCNKDSTLEECEPPKAKKPKLHTNETISCFYTH